MTGPGRGGSVVPWLVAQSFVFGLVAALLGIVANAIFLDAYGATWLPATYIAIGVAGVVVSGAVARSARSAELIRIALAVLGSAAIILLASWLIAATADAPWVSIPLLVLFPILIQLGFVFIGGQAGRLLDIAGIKASFPRIMAGFPIGAIVGGLIGGGLVGLLDKVEVLLLATAIAQAAFAALVWATGRQFAQQLAPTPAGPATTGALPPEPDEETRPSLGALLARRFVALILGYQVLSALGSQLADYLVFDRAAAQYPDPADLAGFLSGYTSVMNVVSIAFLALLAGPLLRRFGLRLGITANPLILTVFALAMIAALVTEGAASLSLLLVVSAARIADIALTDGTTRTSINATYQVLPERDRLAVQAAVEGIGVPVAIGISGVLILVLNALPSALAATIIVTTITCVIWSGAALLLVRAYGPALVDALRRRRWLDVDAALEATDEDERLAHGLLASPDPRAMRLGVELLGGLDRASASADVRVLADDPRPEVRMTALSGLVAAGDKDARRRLRAEVQAMFDSADAADRLQAARALEWLDDTDREAAAALLHDPDVAVRVAALDAVQHGDRFAVQAILAALREPAMIGAAIGAAERLGDALLPRLEARFHDRRGPTEPDLLRLVHAMTARSRERDQILAHHLGHRDREVGLAIMERLADIAPISPDHGGALDKTLAADVSHAARIIAARTAIEAEPDGDAARDLLCGALADDWDLIRRRLLANRLARSGTDRLAPVLVSLDLEGQAGALAVEALTVELGVDEAARVLAVIDPGLTDAERLDRLGSQVAMPTDGDGWFRDLVEDPDDAWRSPWLRACAIHSAAARGVLATMDTAAARRVGDPIIDEELDRAERG
jgi:TLC ATP/ADP transporter